MVILCSFFPIARTLTDFIYAVVDCRTTHYYLAQPFGQMVQFMDLEWAMLGEEFSHLRTLACQIASDVAPRLHAELLDPEILSFALVQYPELWSCIADLRMATMFAQKLQALAASSVIT
jgi:hypothetical protein